MVASGVSLRCDAPCLLPTVCRVPTRPRLATFARTTAASTAVKNQTHTHTRANTHTLLFGRGGGSSTATGRRPFLPARLALVDQDAPVDVIELGELQLHLLRHPPVHQLSLGGTLLVVARVDLREGPEALVSDQLPPGDLPGGSPRKPPLVVQRHDELVAPGVLPAPGVAQVSPGEPLDPVLVLAIVRSLREPVRVVFEGPVFLGLLRIAVEAELAQKVFQAPHHRNRRVEVTAGDHVQKALGPEGCPLVVRNDGQVALGCFAADQAELPPPRWVDHVPLPGDRVELGFR
mmetsp:Transcript_9047/g.18971  ORF Transcript_9047/g.18971 Transcript_9047/m.18971 type:complete len:290 (+) Transcript_9047:121-990(+)